MKPNLPSWTRKATQAASPRGEFPYLAHLLNGWFHQDYSYEGENLGQIVDKYKQTSSGHDRLETIHDIQRFIVRNGATDQALAEALEAAFHPEVNIEGWDGMTTRQWLLRVAELLA